MHLVLENTNRGLRDFFLVLFHRQYGKIRSGLAGNSNIPVLVHVLVKYGVVWPGTPISLY
jgi:hypothetical protein